MNKNIFDVNYTIGKNTLVEKGTITKIEINGEDVPVFKSDDRTKLGENINIFYPNLVVDKEKTIVKDGVFTLLYVNGHNIPLSGNSEGGTLYGYETGDGTIYYGTDEELHTGDTVYTADDGEIKEETVNDPDDFTRKEDEDVPYEGSEIEDLIPYGDGVDVVYTPNEDPKPGDSVFIATDDDKIEVGGTVTGIDEDGNIIVDGDKTYFMPRMIYTFTSPTYGGLYISTVEHSECYWGYKNTDYSGYYQKSLSLPEYSGESTFGVERTPENDIIYFGNEITDFWKMSSVANDTNIYIAGVNSWDDIVEGTPIFSMYGSVIQQAKIKQVDVAIDNKSSEVVLGKSGKGYINAHLLSSYTYAYYAVYDVQKNSEHRYYALGPSGHSSAPVQVNDHFYGFGSDGEIGTNNDTLRVQYINPIRFYYQTTDYYISGAKISVQDKVPKNLYCFTNGSKYIYTLIPPTSMVADKAYVFAAGPTINADANYFTNPVSTTNLDILSRDSQIMMTKDFVPCIYKGDNKVEIDGVEYTYDSTKNPNFNYE